MHLALKSVSSISKEQLFQASDSAFTRKIRANLLTGVKVRTLLRIRQIQGVLGHCPFLSDNIVGFSLVWVPRYKPCGAQQGTDHTQWTGRVRRSKKELLLFPGGRLEDVLRRAPRQALHSHSWKKQESQSNPSEQRDKQFLQGTAAKEKEAELFRGLKAVTEFRQWL